MNQQIVELVNVAANIATIGAIPFAAWGVYVYAMDQRRETRVEEEKIFLQLSRSYDSFLDRMLEHPDLYREDWRTQDLTLESSRRILFERLISIFEQAYILLFISDLREESPYILRMRASWQDNMTFWCRRPDFRSMLPSLIEGEDPDFSRYLRTIADKAQKQAEKEKKLEEIK